jgi:hypothetical protein
MNHPVRLRLPTEIKLSSHPPGSNARENYDERDGNYKPQQQADDIALT